MADYNNNEKAAATAPVADSVNATGVMPPSTAPGAPGVPAGEHEPTTATGNVVDNEKAVPAEKKANRFDAADVSSRPRWLFSHHWKGFPLTRDQLFMRHSIFSERTQRQRRSSACPGRHVHH